MPSNHGDDEIRKTVPPTPLAIQRFIQGHLDRLFKERQAELEESRLLLSSVSPKVLEANGLALTRLGVLSTSVGIGGKRLVELHRPTAYHNDAHLPPNAFRSGDVVAIVDEAAAAEGGGAKGAKGKAAAKNSKEPAQTDGVVVRVMDTKIVVAISQRRSKGQDAEEEPLPTRCRLIKVANEVTWERMENNLRRLAIKVDMPVRTSRGIRGGGLQGQRSQSDDEESDDDGPKRTESSSQAVKSAIPLPSPPDTVPHLPDLLRILLSLSPPAPLPAQLDAPPLPLYNPSLNEPQRLALSRALTTRQLHLIHGPPGTGKTTLLVELVLQLVLGRGERVLVAGSSNLAVDNLGARLVAFAAAAGSSSKASSKGSPNLKCCRIGHPARILQSLQPHTLDHLATTSSNGELLSDVRSELAAAYSSLSPASASSATTSGAAGNKSTSRRGTSSVNNKRLTGSERRKVWDEVRELRKELKQRERGLFTDTLHDANVVLSTLHGAAGGVLERAMRRSSPAAEGDAPEKKSRRFDTIVIDEACQAIEASTWGAVLDTFEEGKGARLILAGDDKQLGPVVKSESGLPGKKTKKKGEGKDKGKKASVKKEKEDEAEGAIDLAEKAKESLKVDDAADAAATAAHAPAEDEEQEDNSDHDDNDNAAEGASVITKPRQGRPSRLLPPRSLTQTLFTRLLRTYGLGSSIKSLLTVQYRMNEVIMEFPNKEMYGGKLVAHDSCKDRWVGDGGVAGGWTVEKGEGMDVVEGEGLVGGRVVFYDTAGAEMYESSNDDNSASTLKSSSKSNPHEVEIIRSHLSLLCKTHKFPPSSITLLAPYSAQVSALSTAFPASDWPGMEIGTIDALQGREQDVVIISLVRSSEEQRGFEGEADRVGFLAEERRLNVAMTRARRQLVVVGDSETIRAGGKGGYLERWMDWLEERAVLEPVLPVT